MSSRHRLSFGRHLSLAVLLLASACGPRAPWESPPPTPTRYVPSALLTPRPTAQPPTATPFTEATRQPQATAAPPTATPTPQVAGTPVKVSEPLQGYVFDDRLYSPIIGESFTYRIYLPPGYFGSTRRYPSLYMLHGNGGNYTEWTDSYLPEQTDRLIVAGEIEPLIVIMPDDGESTYYANWSDGGPRWADYITDDVVSTIDRRYRTLAKPESRAVGGMSMGGLGALNLALRRPDVFGVVGAHSPSVRLKPDPMLWFLVGDNFWEHNPVWLAQNRAGIESLRIWIDAGSDDVWLPNIKAVHEAFVQRGIEPSWNMFPGPHEAEYWIEHVPDYLRFYSEALQRE